MKQRGVGRGVSPMLLKEPIRLLQIFPKLACFEPPPPPFMAGDLCAFVSLRLHLLEEKNVRLVCLTTGAPGPRHSLFILCKPTKQRGVRLRVWVSCERGICRRRQVRTHLEEEQIHQEERDQSRRLCLHLRTEANERQNEDDKKVSKTPLHGSEATNEGIAGVQV